MPHIPGHKQPTLPQSLQSFGYYGGFPGYYPQYGYGSQSPIGMIRRQFAPGFRRGQQYKYAEKAARRGRRITAADIAVEHPIAQAKIDESFASRGLGTSGVHLREKKLAKHRMVDIPTAQMYKQRKNIRDFGRKRRMWDYLI